MDRVIGILRVVAAPMVKKTVNLDFVQNMKFVSNRMFSLRSSNSKDCGIAMIHSTTVEACQKDTHFISFFLFYDNIYNLVKF